MRRLLATIALLSLPLPAVAKTKAAGSWAAPDLKAAAYSKVVVYAKLQDESVRRVMEDAAVRALASYGSAGVPAYQVLTEEDLVDRPTVEAKLKSIGADGALVFLVAEQGVKAKPQPTFSIGIGVMSHSAPVGVGIGTTVPIGGDENSTYMVFGIRSEFHALAGEGPRWIGNYTTDILHGGATAAQEVAELTVKNMKKARVLKVPD